MTAIEASCNSILSTSQPTSESPTVLAIPPMPPVLFEDTDLLAVNKPAGLVVHPAYKNPAGTLVDAVFARQTACGESRPWLLHRLDRETSGVVLFAKTPCERRGLIRQFERRMVRKHYLAIVCGSLPTPTGTIDAPLRRDPADRRRTIIAKDEDGQSAETRYHLLAAYKHYALVLVAPRTGRTHQIRAHFAALGAPLAGDVRYDERQEHGVEIASRVMLHAWRIAFIHSAVGKSLQIVAPMPTDMLHLAEKLQLATDLAYLTDAFDPFGN